MEQILSEMKTVEKEKKKIILFRKFNFLVSWNRQLFWNHFTRNSLSSVGQTRKSRIRSFHGNLSIEAGKKFVEDVWKSKILFRKVDPGSGIWYSNLIIKIDFVVYFFQRQWAVDNLV